MSRHPPSSEQARAQLALLLDQLLRLSREKRVPFINNLRLQGEEKLQRIFGLFAKDGTAYWTAFFRDCLLGATAAAFRDGGLAEVVEAMFSIGFPHCQALHSLACIIIDRKGKGPSISLSSGECDRLLQLVADTTANESAAELARVARLLPMSRPRQIIESALKRPSPALRALQEEDAAAGGEEEEEAADSDGEMPTNRRSHGFLDDEAEETEGDGEESESESESESEQAAQAAAAAETRVDARNDSAAPMCADVRSSGEESSDGESETSSSSSRSSNSSRSNNSTSQEGEDEEEDDEDEGEVDDDLRGFIVSDSEAEEEQAETSDDERESKRRHDEEATTAASAAVVITDEGDGSQKDDDEEEQAPISRSRRRRRPRVVDSDSDTDSEAPDPKRLRRLHKNAE